MKLYMLALAFYCCSLQGCPGCVLKEGTLPNRITITYDPPVMCLPDKTVLCPTKETYEAL